MDDLISRQAAIAEFNCCELTPDGGIDANDAIDILERLPSAQPDKDMIHLQKEQAYMQGWEEGRKALREEIWENERDRLD